MRHAPLVHYSLENQVLRSCCKRGKAYEHFGVRLNLSTRSAKNARGEVTRPHRVHEYFNTYRAHQPWINRQILIVKGQVERPWLTDVVEFHRGPQRNAPYNAAACHISVNIKQGLANGQLAYACSFLRFPCLNRFAIGRYIRWI